MSADKVSGTSEQINQCLPSPAVQEGTSLHHLPLQEQYTIQIMSEQEQMLSLNVRIWINSNFPVE